MATEIFSPKALTDSELYQKCQDYGLNAKQWLRKFAGLLPEVLRRRLHKRRGYISIHEFAAKLEDKPMLKEKFENGLIGWTKLELVTRVATMADEGEWAVRADRLTHSALEIFVKDFDNKKRLGSDGAVTFTDQNWNESTRERFSFEVSSKTAFKFRKFKQQFEKERGEAMSFEQVLGELLTRVEKGASTQKKVIVVERCLECVKRRELEKVTADEVKRAIPMAVQQVVRARQNDCCAFPDCTQPLTSFHHTQRFALVQSHDPDFVVGLCTAHERVAHASLIENETQASSKWAIRAWPQKNTAAFAIDQKVAAFRREPTSTG